MVGIGVQFSTISTNFNNIYIYIYIFQLKILQIILCWTSVIGTIFSKQGFLCKGNPQGERISKLLKLGQNYKKLLQPCSKPYIVRMTHLLTWLSGVHLKKFPNSQFSNKCKFSKCIHLTPIKKKCDRFIVYTNKTNILIIF